MTTEVQTTIPMVVRADHVPGPRQGCWTYEHYAALPEDGTRDEIIDGVLYIMPSPNTGHQGTSMQVSGQLWAHVELPGLGRVFAAPFAVELQQNPTVTVQPDVVVVLKANEAVITASHVVGTPDLVVEILSPGTAGYDRRIKQDAYARARVPEFWLVDPYARSVEVLWLEGDTYVSAGAFAGTATLPSRVLPEFPVRVEQFFP